MFNKTEPCERCEQDSELREYTSYPKGLPGMPNASVRAEVYIFQCPICGHAQKKIITQERMICDDIEVKAYIVPAGPLPLQ